MTAAHHLGQLKKNWGVFTLLLLVVFSAGVVWAFTERDFVEVQTFDVHVAAEEKYVDEKFKAQEKFIEEKFENMDEDIGDLDKDIEKTQRTLEEIKDLID